MAINKVLIVFIAIDIIFLACAAGLIALPFLARRAIAEPPNFNTIAAVVLLNDTPLTAILVNGIFMVVAFAVSFPAIFLHTNRVLVTLHSWLVWICAMITLGTGLSVWVLTLKTTKNLAPVFDTAGDAVVSMLQQRFQCCGYNDPTRFVRDATCPNASDAARHGLCAPPFSSFANQFLGEGFTAMFGICAIDGMLILAALCLLKQRAEQARYRLIDAKQGYRG